MRHVLIADDHEITRRGLRELLADEFPDVKVVEACNGNEALRLFPDHPWDVVLLDIMMPGPTVLELIASIRSQREVPILVLTAATEIEYVLQTLQAGANGLIHKHRAADELIDAIRQVADGSTYLHPETAAQVASSIRGSQDPLPHEALSPREMAIFRRIATGDAIKEIAADLDLSDKTVATYLGRIREKTGLNSHVDIARYALQHGLVD